MSMGARLTVPTAFLACILAFTANAIDLNDGLLKGRFWLGVNMGSSNVFPFSKAPYNQTAATIKELHRQAILDIAATGSNIIRLWLHVDGSINPTWTAAEPGKHPGLASGLEVEALEDLKWFLGASYASGLRVILSLWSHDILAVRKFVPESNRARAVHLVTTAEGRAAYINKVLTPLVRHLKTTSLPEAYIPAGNSSSSSSRPTYADALLSWEVFNEAEGDAWATGLYANYQYTVKHGVYEWEDPDWFAAQPARAGDKRTLDFLRPQRLGPSPTSPNKSLFKGFYFLMGPFPNKSPSGFKQQCYTKEAYQALRAAAVAPLSPEQLNSTKPDEIPSDMSFNPYVYWDVFTSFPMEYDFLLEHIATCQLGTVEVPMRAMQLFTAEATRAIKEADPEALVTSGMKNVLYSTQSQALKADPSMADLDPSPPQDFYSCAALEAVWTEEYGSKPCPKDSRRLLLGTSASSSGCSSRFREFSKASCLDYYAPHSYPIWGNWNATLATSPFLWNKTHLGWAEDMPIIIGEFWDQWYDQKYIAAEDFAGLWRKGYSGATAWAWLQAIDVPPAVAGGRPTRIIGLQELQPKWKKILPEAAAKLQQMGVPLRV